MKKAFRLMAILTTVSVLGLVSCTKEKTFTVTFDANGGSGTMTAQTFTGDESKALTANAFVKEGYEFVSWNTVADGSGRTFSDKQVITLTNNMTLYAQWSAIIPPTPEELLKGKWVIQEYRVEGEKWPEAVGQNWNFKVDGTFVGWLDVPEETCHCSYVFDNMLILKGGELVDYDEGSLYEVQYRMYVDELTETDLQVSGKIVEIEVGTEEYEEERVEVKLKRG